MAKKTTWTVKAPGVRLNSRTREYEALATFYIGTYPTLEKAIKAKAHFTEAVTKLRDKLRGDKPAAKKSAPKPKVTRKRAPKSVPAEPVAEQATA